MSNSELSKSAVIRRRKVVTDLTIAIYDPQHPERMAIVKTPEIQEAVKRMGNLAEIMSTDEFVESTELIQKIITGEKPLSSASTIAPRG